MSLLTSAIAGVTTASARFDRSALRTINDASQNKDIVSDVVEQIDSRTAFTASLNVMKAADEMLGRVLDIKA